MLNKCGPGAIGRLGTILSDAVVHVQPADNIDPSYAPGVRTCYNSDPVAATAYCAQPFLTGTQVQLAATVHPLFQQVSMCCNVCISGTGMTHIVCLCSSLEEA